MFQTKSSIARIFAKKFCRLLQPDKISAWFYSLKIFLKNF